jgi:hypothetical protein
LSGAASSVTDTLDFSRVWKDVPVWPERDPEPEILNTDPRPDDAPDAPKSVQDLAKLGKAAGWDVRVGYSRALLRGTTNSTYRKKETFGVWFGTGHVSGWRACAMYQRFTDKTLVHRFDGEEILPVGKPAGVPGTWKWESVTIFSGFTRHPVSVTDLKEFVSVRGSVLPTWFEAVRTRIAEQEAEQKRKAKERPKKAKEGAN